MGVELNAWQINKLRFPLGFPWQHRLDRRFARDWPQNAVIAYDPFLSTERAVEIGVETVELADLLARADFITLHTPLTAQTRNILSAENLAKTKTGVRIINCARGGLVDEAGAPRRA